MNLQSALFMMAFLGIFQVIGGLAIGSGLRGLRTHGGSSLFLLIWGAGFGGIPLLMSLLILALSNYPLFALIGPIVFLGAIGFSIFLLPRLLQDFDAGTLITLGMGAIFLFVGLGVGVLLLLQRQFGMALIFGGIFTLVGGLLCAVPIGALIRGKTVGS